MSGNQLKPFHYDMVIMAEDQAQADRVMAERIYHDEDLREYGVNEYTISASPAGGREPEPIEVRPEAPEGTEETRAAAPLEPAIDLQGPVTSLNGEQYFSLIRINRALGGSYTLPSATQVYVFAESRYVLEFSYQLPEGCLQIRLDEDGALHGVDVQTNGELTVLTEGALYDLLVGATQGSVGEQEEQSAAAAAADGIKLRDRVRVTAGDHSGVAGTVIGRRSMGTQPVLWQLSLDNGVRMDTIAGRFTVI